MYIDFEDNRPDTPHLPQALTPLEGILITVVIHLLVIIAVLLAPARWFKPSEVVALSQPVDEAPLRFIEVAPVVERPAPPKRPADQSDLDRRATTIARAPQPKNDEAFSKGNTPERIVAAPEERIVGPETPAPPTAAPVPTPPAAGLSLEPAPVLPTPPQAASGGALGQSLRNLRQYLRNENFDNQLGGDADQSADIQFDSMGVDFGPWLRRFKNQVERNWIVPQAAMVLKGRVVIQFYVLRNGTIADLRVVQPSSVQPFTTAALNALKLSNPTAELPREYPADRAFFTVTFHYNEGRDDRR